jgi:GNAT superfamily N-acetyltransferase
MSRIQIKQVSSKQDLEGFIRLPWIIYKDDPYWVPQLLNEVRELLDTKRHPFWRHAKRRLFFAKRDGEIVGRIAAVIDDLYIDFHQERAGFFGFFECINDLRVANALFEEVKRWCRENGMQVLRGPVSPSMNYESGLLIEGFDSSPTVMMPYNPRYYVDLLQGCRFRKAKDLYALIKAGPGIPERIQHLIERVKKRERLTIRPIDMKRLKKETQVIREIYNSAWQKNWGFVPMTDDEFYHMAKKIKQFADPRLILIAEVDDRPVGVSITLPDINQVLKRLNGRLGPIEIAKFLYYRKKIDGLRSLIGGVRKEHRSTGIIAALYYETEKMAVKLGYKWCELGWNLEDNELINRFDMAIGARIYKRYRIYETDI